VRAVWQYVHNYAGAALRKSDVHVAGQRYRSPQLHDEGRLSSRVQGQVGFLLDPLSSIWLLFVTGVGMLIHIYSIGYMAHEEGTTVLRVSEPVHVRDADADSGEQLYPAVCRMGGVGLCSYLLIGFYFHRKSASDAANKAFIVNRIGTPGSCSACSPSRGPWVRCALPT